MRPKISILLCICTFLAITSLTGQVRSPIKVIFENEGHETYLEARQREEVFYVKLEKLAEILSVRNTFNPSNKKMVLRVGSREIKVTALNPFLMIDSDVYQMALPPIDVDGDIFIPLSLFLNITSSYFPGEISFSQHIGELRIQRSAINITGVEVEEKLNGSLIRFVTTKSFKESDIATSVGKGWLNVTLYGGILDSVQIASDEPVSMVKKIVPIQSDESAQVSFQLNGEVTDRSVFIEDGEVRVSIRNPNQRVIQPEVKPVEDRKRWLIDKIVIDPGHGGRDPGAVSANGVKEKDVNLDVSKRLKRLIEKNLDVEVLLTRSDDRLIPLWERTQFANANDAKLFISIHANSNPSRTARGVSTYVLGTEKNEQALAVAEKENSVIEFEESIEKYEELQDAAHILNAIAQSAYLKESMDLASMVTENLAKKTKLPKFGNGLFQGRLIVLIGAAMPRILIETAFLSNRHEERKLRTRAFRQKLAEAIYESIAEFKEKCETGIS